MTMIWNIAWRASLLLLPWQTRWFWDASLAGWPWEQGRVSLYVSWVVLLVTVVVGSRRARLSWRPSKILVGLLVALFGINLIATRFEPPALIAMVQWWIQIGFLFAWTRTMKQSALPWTSVATWFVLSLLPHAALGFVQYAMQRVEASTFLGIAQHLAETPGTSVVEHGVYRVLRIYGGFPHPNVFGGWLAIGIMTTLLLAAVSQMRRQALFSIFASAAFSVALLLTYSRSAWIAAVVGAITLFIYLFRSKLLSQFFWVAVASCTIAVGIVGYTQIDHILARSDTVSRLESQSVNARVQSLQNGRSLFQSHALIGTGPNGVLHALAASLDIAKTTQPLEPPHNVFLLALAELGVIGTLLVICIIGYAKRMRVVSSWLPMFVYVAPLLVIGFFDHYLWSLWAGASLVFTAYLLASLRASST